MIVNLHAPGIIHLPDGTMLKSGMNEVSAKTVEQFKKHPQLKSYIDEGIVTFHEQALQSKEEDKSYLKMAVKSAIDLATATIDKELLEKWKSEETRKPVLNAIEKQLKELNTEIVRRSDGTTEEKDETTNLVD